MVVPLVPLVLVLLEALHHQLVLEEVHHRPLEVLEEQLVLVVRLQLGLPEVPERLVLVVLEGIPVALLPERLVPLELEERLGQEERLHQQVLLRLLLHQLLLQVL